MVQKRIFAHVIAFLMAICVFAFVGCDEQTPTPSDNSGNKTTTTEFTITYEFVGGEFESDGLIIVDTFRVKYTQSGEPIVLITPIKTGYEFVGWQEGNSEPITVLIAGTTGNKNFTAVWEAKTYNIIFDNSSLSSITDWADTSSGTKTVQVKYGEKINVPQIKSDLMSQEDNAQSQYIFRYWYYRNESGDKVAVDLTKNFTAENFNISDTNLTLYVYIEQYMWTPFYD